MEIKIPKQFQLMGQTINVKFDNELRTKEECVGVSYLDFNEMKLQRNIDGNDRTDEQIYHTFLHELTHFILNKLGEEKLNKNEKLVDTFSALLAQAFQTSRYE